MKGAAAAYKLIQNAYDEGTAWVASTFPYSKHNFHQNLRFLLLCGAHMLHARLLGSRVRHLLHHPMSDSSDDEPPIKKALLPRRHHAVQGLRGAHV